MTEGRVDVSIGHTYGSKEYIQSLSMILQEAIIRSEKKIQYKIDWYAKRIGKETELLETLEKAKGYIE